MRKDVFEVLQMDKEIQKVNYAKIARCMNCDWRTVKRHFNARDQNLPKIRKKRIVKKVISGFEEIIKEKYLNDGAPAIAIYHLLKDKYQYKGSYSTIKAFIHEIKEHSVRDAVVRFETNPGLQAQIDWKETLTLVNKENRPFVVNIFLCILGYSRLKYIELTLDRTQPTLFSCLTNAFKYYGGTPRELLFDNTKTVVDRSRTQFNSPVYNGTFYSFSKDAGFRPLSCLPFTPKTKGKVEVVAKIMNRLKVHNHEFSVLDDLNKIVKQLLFEINNEVNQTTLEKPFNRFEKEKEYLQREPNYELLETYFSTRPLERKVPKDSLITFQNRKYSVPPKYVGKKVSLKIERNNLSIYYNGNFVCSHIIDNKKINYKKEHYEELMGRCLSDNETLELVCKNNLELFDKL